MVTQHLARYPSLADEVRELSIDESDCNDHFEHLYENEDYQWPEHIRSRMLAHPSLFSNSNGQVRISNYVTVATIALIVCTKVHTLNLTTLSLAPMALPEAFLRECIELGQSRLDNTHAPLANLRKLTVEAPQEPEYEDQFMEQGQTWFNDLLRLPQITAISLYDIPYESTFTSTLTSGVKYLSLSKMEDLSVSKLESILEACPLLEGLELTTKPTYQSDRTLNWGEIGTALNRYGSQLRKLRIDNSKSSLLSPKEFGLINLASLSHLRSLFLPVEAVLQESAGEYDIPDTKLGDYGASANTNMHDMDTEEEEYFRDLHTPEQGLNTPTIPLHQLLPQSLKYIRITDEWDLWADATRLDIELRDLMLHPQFSELRAIRVRRRMQYTRHVKNLGWRYKRREQMWNVLLRS